MHRQELRDLADVRLKEAVALFDAGLFSGSYYLAGYSVECALKACIANSIEAHVVRAKKFENAFYTHNLVNLATTAGLFRIDTLDLPGTDAELADRIGVNWTTAKDWNEDSRYKLWTEKDANDLIKAIDDSEAGILTWLKTRW